jgi:tetratricopeptide (TPR) repeat protein
MSGPAPPSAQPSAFANGRYTVTRFLGEGGKKKVYLAHDASLDRDVAFALIKTEGLDAAARERITREAQAMGRLGAHPHIVTVFDIGEEQGQPYLVLPVLGGGDVEGIIEKAPEHKLPIDQAIKIAVETCLGLEFAHGKGIIHRDIKPGNVWLTEDGRAMVGDFGLAVAVDRSRLTQAGMMVGTVNYMPPEQAMGGEITPRSDLYALGAMLYEMVCGRPPFIGDESVAIIGQHLNTPPVAPSWHRPDCPPALEPLILRLLEKDPSKRPESATEVRDALQSITTSPAGNQTAAHDLPPAGENPLYRRTFVGRENEVKQLQQAFDAAMSGQGGLVMVVGEPGIGKTAICEQLATYVALRGGKTLVGHCYEEGSLSLPYLAFVEAMRSYVLARDPDGLRTDLGTGAADVARIVSEVRDRVQGVELRPAGDPEDDRWRLLQAVTGFLRNASTVQPLCIVLEDLHWADRGTLDLLLHVSRNLAGTRLLVVGTYRDVEVDRSHPLSGILADLRRIDGFSRVPLRGLTVDEVHRMYEALRGNSVPWAQAEAVHRATEGNPLFVQEVLRYLVEEGFVVRADGRYIAAQGVGAGIPEGLRDVIGKRLSRLSAECNRALSIAAVIGRDFDLATLRGVAGLAEDDLLSAIEEAVHVGVLEEHSLPGAVRYRFAHAFFRQSLYEEMIAPRRLRLHQEVARALETQYASRREEHAAELAEHYGQSTDRADLAKAIEYSEIAARRAMAVFAYAEAEAHMKRCLEVQEVLDSDDLARFCDLLIGWGDALNPSGSPRQAEDVAERAFAMALELGDHRRAFDAARLALDAISLLGQSALMGGATALRWADRLSEYSGEDKKRQLQAEHRLAQVLYASRQFSAFAKVVQNGLPRARDLKTIDALQIATVWIVNFSQAPSLEAWRSSVLTEVAEAMRAATGHTTGGMSFCAYLARADRSGADEAGAVATLVLGRTRHPALEVYNAIRNANFAFMDGALEESISHARDAIRLAAESGRPILGTYFAAHTALWPMIYLGRAEEHLSLIEELRSAASEGEGRNFFARAALCMAALGRSEEARALLGAVYEPMVANNEVEFTPTRDLTEMLGVALLCSDRDRVSVLVEALAPAQSLFASHGGYFASIARLLGEGDALLGRNDDARGHYELALERCRQIGFRPDVALTRLGLAELLLEHYPHERDAAVEHLDFAIAEFQDMKMRPALERALRHRGLLKA